MDRWINGQDTARANLLVLILNIRVKCCFVFELHDATKCIALSSRRDVWTYMGLK